MSVSDALSAIDRLIKVSNELRNVEQKEDLVSVKAALVDMKEENVALKAENSELKKQLEIKGDMFSRNNTYWLKLEEGEDGPFCYSCYDSQGKLSRMSVGNHGYGQCPTCKYGAQVYPEKIQRHINWNNTMFE